LRRLDTCTIYGVEVDPTTIASILQNTALDVCVAAIDAFIKGGATPLSYVDFEGELLSPGNYSQDAAMNLVGTLYLNIRNEAGEIDLDPEWNLYLTGAFNTGAASKTVFVNVDPNHGSTFDLDGNYVYDSTHLLYDPSDPDATTDAFNTKITDDFDTKVRVQWKLHGAITVGVASNVFGDMHSYGAITVGEDAKVGNLQALGAVSLGPGCYAGSIRATGALTIGSTAHVDRDTIYVAADQTACDVTALLIDCKAEKTILGI
jgi:hypothetical protein